MRFRSFDNLRVFDTVARHLSFTAAAEALNLTKGAVSYQISRLEDDLGFLVFLRQHRGIALTEKGEKLWHASQRAFGDLDREISGLQERTDDRITIGMSTYFASRWLSPRLMRFMARYPRISLRLQPLVDLIDLKSHNIDMAIRWGKAEWQDMAIESLLPCPAFATAGAGISQRIAAEGLAAALHDIPLLHDRDGSSAWLDWHDAAGIAYRSMRDDLVVPDPNVRVQAVVDGQGLALNDALVVAELDAGRLFKVSNIELGNYGYHLAYPAGALAHPALKAFRDWIISEAPMA